MYNVERSSKVTAAMKIVKYFIINCAKYTKKIRFIYKKSYKNLVYVKRYILKNAESTIITRYLTLLTTKIHLCGHENTDKYYIIYILYSMYVYIYTTCRK